MSRAKELLEQATPLPWRVNQESFDRVYGADDDVAITDDCCTSPSDAAFIVYAVNRLPAYEAAVEALENLLGTRVTHCSIGDGPYFHATDAGCDFTNRGPECDCEQRVDDARAALARLRDEVLA